MSSFPIHHKSFMRALQSLAAAVIVAVCAAVPALAQHDVRRSLPVSSLQGFVANQGQWDEEVLFFGVRDGIAATLTADAILLRPLPDTEADEPAPEPIILRLPAPASVGGEGLLPTAHHFILGSGTTSNVPGYARVVYRDVVPGIDLVFRQGGRWFAYDLHVDAGANLTDLVLEVEGVSDCSIVEDDALGMVTAAGLVEQRIGDCWQIDGNGGRQPVMGSRFSVLTSGLEGRMRFGFYAPGRDPTRAFVLDPSLVWATYVGGTTQELLRGMGLGPDDSVYLAARVPPTSDAPTTPGAFQPTSPRSFDAWVGKLSADGTTLEWGTFLGTDASDVPEGLAVDWDGSVVVVGDTWSRDFPTTAGSVQPGFAGQNDMYIARLTPDGSGLVWSTFYGGTQNDHADDVVLFANGDVLLSAQGDTSEPPATPGAYDTVYDPNDRMLVRLSADGTAVAFQTYFASGAIHLALGPDESIYLAGTAGESLPATTGAFKESIPPGGFNDGFVARMDPMGSQLHWATYLGGDDLTETIPGIAIDAAGAVYVAGLTGSDDFPVTPGAFATFTNAPDSGFVTKLLPGGTDLVWSTYIGGCCSGTSQMWDIAVDAAGHPISVGSSNEPGFPTTPDALQPTYIGGFGSSDAHLTKFGPFGEALEYSTYFGGTSSDRLPMVVLDYAQDPIVSLDSFSSDIPVTPGAYDPTYAPTSTDLVVTKFDFDLLPWEVLGGGLAGAIDTPNLAGGGALTPGSLARLSLRGAAPSTNATIVGGAFAIYAPLKGGTLVPAPSVLVSLPTDAQGAWDLPFVWPTLPSGLDLYVQVWVADAGGPVGFSASNALKMTSQ